MTARYLLPCHGDRVVEVTVALAGHTVTCPCGKSVVVPTLRELKRLPVAAAETSARSSAAPWTLQQGILFSLGLLLIAASGVALGVIGFKRSKLSTEAAVLRDEFHQQLGEEIGAMEPSRTLDFWRMLREIPLPDRNYVMTFEEHRKQSAKLLNRMLFAGGVGVLGGSLVLAGLLYKPRPPKARAKRAVMSG
jgi:hypothetical protein